MFSTLVCYKQGAKFDMSDYCSKQTNFEIKFTQYISELNFRGGAWYIHNSQGLMNSIMRFPSHYDSRKEQLNNGGLYNSYEGLKNFLI